MTTAQSSLSSSDVGEPENGQRCGRRVSAERAREVVGTFDGVFVEEVSASLGGWSDEYEVVYI